MRGHDVPYLELTILTLIAALLTIVPIMGSPARASGPSISPDWNQRYVVYLPGVCPDKPVTSQLGINCNADKSGHLDAKTRAVNPSPSVASFMELSNLLPTSYHAIYFSYGPSTSSYTPADTQQHVDTSAQRLESQIKTTICKNTHATFDLVGHSLGGAVAAYWLVTYGPQTVSCAGTPIQLLDHVHSLVTFDSPLQGVDAFTGYAYDLDHLHEWVLDLIGEAAYGAVGASVVDYFSSNLTSTVGKDLTSQGTAIEAINDPRHGALALLPKRILAISDTGDSFIGPSEAWIGSGDPQKRAANNPVINDCASGPHDLVCHTNVLSDSLALQWARDMIVGGTLPTTVAGGVWLSPGDGSTASGSPSDPPIHFRAHVFATRRGDQVDHVNFTGLWQIGRSPQWHTLCQRVAKHDAGDYSCEWHAPRPPGLPQSGSAKLKLGFDVYLHPDERQAHRLSPDGNRVITVAFPAAPAIVPTPAPSVVTPTNTPAPPAPASPTNTPSPAKPGGVWISPNEGDTVSDVIHFAAHAYPTGAGEPAIDHVSFTVGWAALGSQPWKVCTATPPASGDIFTCDADLRQMGAPPGPLQVSFDVYDTAGQFTLAPNGVHDVTYVSQPVRPGGLWVSPQDGSTTSGAVTFAAEAYPSNAGDPGIGFVNFTIGWPAANPNNWMIVCTVNAPSGQATDGHDIYSCTKDLSQLNPPPPPGPVRISFDVYDQQYQPGSSDHYTDAPNGEHTIAYQPQPVTQGETLTLNPTSGPAGSTVCLIWTDDDDQPGASGTISFDDQQIGTYQSDPSSENWSGCLQIPGDAQPGQHTISLHETTDDSAGSATFTVTTTAGPACGQQLGQHCSAIWMGQSSYAIGQPLQLCYSVAGPSYVVITDYPPDGSNQVIVQEFNNGTGNCFTGTTSGPVGLERVHLDVYTQLGGSLIGSADTSFQVTQGS